MTVPVSSWEERAAAFKADLAAKIPAKWVIEPPSSTKVADITTTSGLLDERELNIIQHDASSLAKAIARKDYTAVEVTMAFAKAGAVVHQVTNCVMDFDLNTALERATWLDAELERTGKTVGPFHGVPISIKGHVGVEGTISYVGFLSSCIKTPDSILVKILRDAGAVFIVKTAVAQAVMQLESDSFLGPVVNPYNQNLTAGGSTGGEGALLGGRGSVIGVGSDIGGSIRVPSAINGLYGFKPTVGRLPRGGGGVSIYGGQDSIIGTTGPMGHSAEDMTLFMSVILDAQPWRISPVCLAMPWRMEEVHWKGGEKPRIGVMWDDGVVKPLPPMRRVLRAAVDKLKAQGYDIVDFAPYRTKEVWSTLAPLYMTDGGKRMLQHSAAGGESLHPLTTWIMEQTKELTTLELQDAFLARDAFRFGFLHHYEASGVDVILSLPGAGPANKLNTSTYWSYTALWNLLDYPAGVFPTGSAVQVTDVPDAPYAFWSEEDETMWKLYDSPESFKDAPLSLQVAGPRYEDERVCKAIEIISKAVYSE